MGNQKSDKKMEYVRVARVHEETIELNPGWEMKIEVDKIRPIREGDKKGFMRKSRVSTKITKGSIYMFLNAKELRILKELIDDAVGPSDNAEEECQNECLENGKKFENKLPIPIIHPDDVVDSVE